METKSVSSVQKKKNAFHHLLCAVYQQVDMLQKKGDEIVVEMKEVFVYINEEPNISMER